MIAIVDYGLGNLQSVRQAFERIGFEALVTSDPITVRRAAKLVLPGVGSFAAGLEKIGRLGLREILDTKAREGTPILGICLGLQLMTVGSEEGGGAGFGWLDAETTAFPVPPGAGLKVPHLGWNTVTMRRRSVLLKNLPAEPAFSFAHSYFIRCRNEGDVVAETRHGVVFASVVQSGALFGTQFHPEKSHGAGLQLLRNFAGFTGGE